MPLIHIRQTPGRTAEQKREIAREVTEAYVRATGVPPEKVWLTVEEVPLDNWAVGGETFSAKG
ncbi:4-oxalocrotonate tautomerase family protein [Streptomyces sp. NPDC004539]|uniref:tautomerase family protein n=1 Tax=Streptomyces sp. NPDC004539 TaxID=3154280 RepID=UPI0033BE1445